MLFEIDSFGDGLFYYWILIFWINFWSYSVVIYLDIEFGVKFEVWFVSSVLLLELIVENGYNCCKFCVKFLNKFNCIVYRIFNIMNR